MAAVRRMVTDCVFLIGPRACGKSTVARAMGALLPEWTVVDIDYEYRVRLGARNGGGNGETAISSNAEYYAQCRKILLETIWRPRLIVALNGGALVNDVAPTVGAQNLQTCRARGKLVLLLPSWFEWKNRSILFEREKKRYPITRERAVKIYNRRIPYLRQYADYIVYGSPPERVARKIIRRYRLA